MDCFTVKLNENAGTEMSAALSDAIMVKGLESAAGSNMLKGFVSPFDAAVVERLKAAGVPIAGLTRTDEFGAEPFFGENLPEGALTVVSQGIVSAALSNDFSGKTLRLAPKTGVCSVRPTYGTVPRYGLVASVCSMDQIGVAAKDLKTAFKTLSVIAGTDARDGAMFPEERYNYEPEHKDALKIGTAGNEYALEPFETVKVELPFAAVLPQVMAILTSAELAANISRCDGVKFGFRAEDFKGLNDLYVKSRTRGFGRGVKLWAMLGAYVLGSENYAPLYEKAMKIRRLIVETLPFDKCDVLALPAEDAGLAALPALCGLPAVSFPRGEGGLILTGPVKSENTLFAAGEAVRS